MKTKLNDEELIRQHFTTYPNGCFEALYSRYVGKVYNRCLSLTKDAEKAREEREGGVKRLPITDTGQ